MSAIRLFLLATFAELGPMHGHRLRLEAEREHVHLWTDVTVGAVYGAIKRLATEGLLREAGVERIGNRPERTIYEITEAGREALADLRRAGLKDVWFQYDPFDVALARGDAETLDAFPAVLAERRDAIEEQLAQRRRDIAYSVAYTDLAEEWALRHTEYRLEAELAYVTDLLRVAGDIVADERAPRPRKEMALPARGAR